MLSGPKEVIEKDGVKVVASAEELYSICDVISLHIPQPLKQETPLIMLW